MLKVLHSCYNVMQLKWSHKIWLCYDFASNSGLYWIAFFYKKDFKTAHIRRFTSYTLSRQLSQIIICSSLLLINTTAWKVSKYGVISGPYFLVFGLNTEITKQISVFNPNTGKYGPEITPYLGTFHTVSLLSKRMWAVDSDSANSRCTQLGHVCVCRWIKRT